MARPKLGRWKILTIAGGVGALCLALLMAYDLRVEHQHRREIPREWARLAPYPASARNLRATTSGGMFSRSFRVTFTAQPRDIERWLRASPGPREATEERPALGKRHFDIRPGGGANHAEVNVDDTSGRVEVNVAWS